MDWLSEKLRRQIKLNISDNGKESRDDNLKLRLSLQEKDGYAGSDMEIYSFYICNPTAALTIGKTALLLYCSRFL